MQTEMQFTSLSAYKKLERVGRKQMDCFKVIENSPASNFDIARELGWEINRVTGRVKELREMDLVEEAYREVHPVTNRRVIYWQVKHDKEYRECINNQDTVVRVY